MSSLALTARGPSTTLSMDRKTSEAAIIEPQPKEILIMPLFIGVAELLKDALKTESDEAKKKTKKS